MSTEPFPPPADADPAESTAAIAPVTPEMMDHAAHAVAERADTVAHEAPELSAEAVAEAPTIQAIEDSTPPSVEVEAAPEQTAPGSVETSSSMSASAAAASTPVDTLAPGTLEPTDLAFTHGGTSPGRMLDGSARSVSASNDSFGLMSAKLLEIAAANMSATGAFVSALLGAKSLSEAAAINADHMQRRLDALTTQGRELLLLAQKVTLDAMRPPHDGSRRP